MGITELLHPEAIVLQMEARNSTQVIEKLGGILNRLGFVKDGFVEATLAREASMPTGLPLGGDVNAAIPHVDIEYVRRPALALATLKKPVVFHNMVEPEEEVPVRLVIMLALDKPKSQIEMLQQVAGILQKPEIVSRLVSAATPEEVFSVLEELEAPA
ncbi:MAG TPA: PTS sugar transporter subunit IIA [Chloroflexi bacterium]|nr:PTS sugar transporter subunit IIA [Chloroflexota bacterium]